MRLSQWLGTKKKFFVKNIFGTITMGVSLFHFLSFFWDNLPKVLTKAAKNVFDAETSWKCFFFLCFWKNRLNKFDLTKREKRFKGSAYSQINSSHSSLLFAMFAAYLFHSFIELADKVKRYFQGKRDFAAARIEPMTSTAEKQSSEPFEAGGSHFRQV